MILIPLNNTLCNSFKTETDNMQDSKELAIRDSNITSFDYTPGSFRNYFTSPFDQYKNYVGKPFNVLKIIRPMMPETKNSDAEDDMYSIQFTDCESKIDAFGHEVCQLNYESCVPKFDN